MTPRPPSKRPERCDLRPELAACFAIRPATARPERVDLPPRGVLAELARYGRP